MHQVYMISALIGGAILLIQLILMMVGGDADGDMDFSADVDDVSVSGSEFFDYLSLKSVFSFLTFFGLAGLAVDSSEWRPFPGATLVVALGAGCIAFYIVGLIMVGLGGLILIGLFVYVIPQITQIFEDSGQELPLLTQVLIGFSHLLREWWRLLRGW